MGRAETNSSRNEVGVFTVCSVPVAPIEDAHDVVTHTRKGLEEADEAMFVVDLASGVAAESAIGNL